MAERRNIRDLPTQERLHQLLHYDPETGALHWRRADGAMGAKAFYRLNTDGYLVDSLEDENSIRAHRVAWKMMTNEEPPIIRHRNKDRTDNRWSNLLAATIFEQRRRTKAARNSKSGHLGVWRVSDFWVAQITRRKRQVFIGQYPSLEEAVSARKEAERVFDETGLLPRESGRTVKQLTLNLTQPGA